MRYQVNEMFDSIQGEGMWAGVPATFIRLQGCTVGCPWCDTKYTWKKGGVSMTTKQILKKVRWQHVVITGGEPTLYDLDELLTELHNLELTTQLETSGQNPLKGVVKPAWTTWSPKQRLGYKAPESIIQMCDEVKFVVDRMLTEEIVDSVLEQLTGDRYIIFMPEGAPPEEKEREQALEFVETYACGHWVRYSDRLQWILRVR